MTTTTLQELTETLEELKALAQAALDECIRAEEENLGTRELQPHVTRIAFKAEALALRIHEAEIPLHGLEDHHDEEESACRRQSTEESVKLAFSSV